MKTLLSLVFFVLVIAVYSPGYAEMMTIAKFSGTIDYQFDDIAQYSVMIGDLDCSSIWGSNNPSDFNGSIELETTSHVGGGTTYLTGLLQRTYIDIVDPDSEYAGMLRDNILWIEPFFVVKPNYDDIWHDSSNSISPIPDLSSYRIDAYYIRNHMCENGTSTSYSTEILVDATPVPEPSTMLLLGGGFVCLVCWRRAGINR